MAKILLVDDDSSYVEVIKELLTIEKYDVTGVTSGLEAIEILKKYKFDLVLLDVVMPDINGFEVCKYIRESKRNLNVMVIMVTGKQMGSEDLINGLEIGADEYLIKPVSMGELLARVKAMLRIRFLQEEIVKRERKSAWIRGMQQVLVTFGQYLAESSTTISSYLDFANLKSKKQIKVFHDMVDNETQVIALVLESLHEVIKKLDAEKEDISKSDILDIESTLKRKLEGIRKE